MKRIILILILLLFGLVTNEQLVEQPTDYWEEWEDFGGRYFTFDIDIPNHRKPEIERDEEDKEK